MANVTHTRAASRPPCGLVREWLPRPLEGDRRDSPARQQPPQPHEGRPRLELDATQRIGVGPDAVRPAPADHSGAIPGVSRKLTDGRVLLRVRIAKRRHCFPQQRFQLAPRLLQLVRRLATRYRGKRCVRSGVRAECDATCLHLENFVRTKQRLLYLVSIPRVCPTDQIGDEKHRCGKLPPFQRGPCAVICRAVTIVKSDDYWASRHRFSALAEREPLFKCDGLVPPSPKRR